MFPKTKTVDEVMATADAVAMIAAEKGVNTLQPVATAQVVPITPAAQTQPSAGSTRKERATAKDQPAGDEPLMERLTMQIPATVMEQIIARTNARINGKRPTIRYVILKALTSDGFDVDEKFLVKDGRRERN
jgi:hypothetical protein